ncbi:MAG: precorrin-8X methylmutase [Geminicoccaceae bacterium]
MSALAYIRDPQEITRASFAMIAREAGLDRLPPERRAIAGRVVHGCGMAEVAGLLAWRGDPDAAGRRALAAGAPVLTDSRMVAAGISAPAGVAAPRVVCRLGAADLAATAESSGISRSAAAVDLWRPDLAGAVVAIGNAPTALFRLLERLTEWPERPAVILAFPVGFVGAAESKQALIDSGLDVPFVTLPGRLGGSAMAASAVNALLRGAP